jgi:hypothetical protein
MGYFASMVKYALIFGVIAFLAGYIGPIVVTPEANQGPLLGIFITGPLGFIAGAAFGLVSAFVRQRRGF